MNSSSLSSSSSSLSSSVKFLKTMETPSLPRLPLDDLSLHFIIDRVQNPQPNDAEYAEELLFQEALMASFANPPVNDITPEINSMEIGQSSSSSSSPSSQQFLCEICAETKEPDQAFQVPNCHHLFCTDCISKHIFTQIRKSPDRENMACPGLDCEGILEIGRCLNVIPQEVSSMWGDAICESMISASHKFYCPYRDCSALLVNDAEEVIMESECPSCRRLFCAQCRVPWHAGVGCEEYVGLRENERGREDLMVHELAKAKKWQRCPRCMFFVDKMDGCMHLTCRCGYEFCYGCGEKWMPSHHESCE